MIHGETTIVLKNVKTGLVERVHSENVFQGGVIAKHIRNLGTNNTTVFPRRTNSNEFPLWKKEIGGLFLFKNAITRTDTDVQYMPAGNEMIGAGVVGMTHSGSPNEWGSYNSSESSASLSGITQVYDFTTDQANGTISCVSLTSRQGALIGYGHNGDDYLGNYYNDIVTYDAEQQFPVGWGYKDSNSREWEILQGNPDITAYYPIYNGVMMFRKKRYGLNRLSVFNCLEKAFSFDLTALASNPYNFTSTTYGGLHIYPVGGSVFRIIPARSYPSDVPSTVPASSTVYFYELDADTETLTVGSFMNVTGEAIYYASSNSYPTISFTKDGCAIVRGVTSGCLHKIGISDSILKKSFDRSIDFPGGYYNPGNGYYGNDMVPGLELFTGRGNDNVNKVKVYDTVSGTVKRVNLQSNTRMYYNAELDVCGYNFASYMASGSSSGNWIATNPLYLATINNLDNPVTKTAAQTMKVTYTLTEA